MAGDEAQRVSVAAPADREATPAACEAMPVAFEAMPAAREAMPAAREWTLAATDAALTDKFAQVLGCPQPLASVLVCRGLKSPEEAQAFLNPSLDQLHDPALMLGMKLAVERVTSAIQRSEPILIYGDYDVDGTVATVLLKSAIERTATALQTTADVRYHIPHRIREGYGMQASRLEAAREEGVRLVVSVDTGIRAFAAADEARRLGLDLIVTDHHLPEAAEGVPRALAVLNPNQPGDTYPTKDLCGAGVAFKLAQALLESSAPDEAARDRLRSKTLPSFLKLLAIATIADSVPLLGENRVIAALGLRELRKPSQSGLRELMELAGIDLTREISATDVGFRIAPRLNAAGRMDIAEDVVELFLTRDSERAKALAEKLHRLNDERRATEAQALEDIEQRLLELGSAPEGLPSCLVMDDSATTAGAVPWHRGVIGILASRVVDRTGRPALVLAHEDGTAHGSGRSVAGFHLLDALTSAHHEIPEQPLFSRFGGHAHAVGFALPSTSVGELRRRMAERAAVVLADRPELPPLECTAVLRFGEITPVFLDWLERLGPYGHSAPEPLFRAFNVRMTTAASVIKERHLRLSVEDPADGASLSGVAWGRRTNWPALAREWQLAQGSRLDLAFHLRRNWHPQFGGWEMEVVALRPAQETF
jgi:single-stranded-DNA-specific exonuclease